MGQQDEHILANLQTFGSSGTRLVDLLGEAARNRVSIFIIDCFTWKDIFWTDFRLGLCPLRPTRHCELI